MYTYLTSRYDARFISSYYCTAPECFPSCCRFESSAGGFSGDKQGGMEYQENKLNSLKIKRAMPPPFAEKPFY